MRPRVRRHARILVICLAWTAIAAGQEKSLDRLSEEHRSWLRRDVKYIITDREKDVFLSLETLEERGRFIEAFWRRRDPSPAAGANEFKEEHYQRIEYANKFLGRGTFREGWETDRGRYYIMLGEPRSIQRFAGHHTIFDSELWMYEGDVRLGLPRRSRSTWPSLLRGVLRSCEPSPPSYRGERLRRRARRCCTALG